MGIVDPSVMAPYQGNDDGQEDLMRQALIGLGLHPAAAEAAAPIQHQAEQQSAQQSQTQATMAQAPQQISPETLNPDATPDSPQSNVTLAHASMADQPAAKWASDAQGNLDKFQNRPMWKRMLVPALIGAASTIGAHSRNGAALQASAGKSLEDYNAAQVGQRNNLQQQVQAARNQQQSEYELDQRNRQQDLQMQGNNQARTLMAQIAAQSRQGVAGTNAGARVQSAQIGGDSRENVADTNADAKVTTGKYAADKAQGRFDQGQANQFKRQQIGIDAAAGRQGAGFSHQDNKPTATEDNRADLAQNLNENLDKAAAIFAKHPEYSGKLAGRLTQAKMLVGTNDQDLGALKTIMDQVGMASMGAHSMRNGHLVETIGNDLTNSMHNGPDAVQSAIRAAKDSVATFGSINRPTSLASKVKPAANQVPPNLSNFHVNPSTKQRIGTNDGGRTWYDTSTGKQVQ